MYSFPCRATSRVCKFGELSSIGFLMSFQRWHTNDSFDFLGDLSLVLWTDAPTGVYHYQDDRWYHYVQPLAKWSIDGLGPDDYMLDGDSFRVSLGSVSFGTYVLCDARGSVSQEQDFCCRSSCFTDLGMGAYPSFETSMYLIEAATWACDIYIYARYVIQGWMHHTKYWRWCLDDMTFVRWRPYVDIEPWPTARE